MHTDQGRCIDYDTLVLATGSYPFVSPIEGNDQPHCHVYRTIEDLNAIKAVIAQKIAKRTGKPRQL